MTKIAHVPWSKVIHNPFTGEIAIHRGQSTKNIDGWWCGTKEHATSERWRGALKAIGVTPEDRLEKGTWFREQLSLIEDAIELQTTDSEKRDHSYYFLNPETKEDWKTQEDRSEIESFTFENNYVYEIAHERADSQCLWDPITGTQWVKDGKPRRKPASGWWRIRGNKITAMVRSGPLAKWWEKSGGLELSELDEEWREDRLWEILADWQSTSPWKKSESALPDHIAVIAPSLKEEIGTEIAIFRCGGYIPPKTPKYPTNRTH
jgi:hypothetical protein